MKEAPSGEKKYGTYCTAIAQNILGNREDAEEAATEAGPTEAPVKYIIEE